MARSRETLKAAPRAEFGSRSSRRLRGEGLVPGVVYGGGLEWQIAYGVSVRAEYLHYDVGGIAYIPASFPASDNGDYVKFDDVDVVRAGVNVRLGHY